MDRGAAVYALYIDMYRRWQTLQKTVSGSHSHTLRAILIYGWGSAASFRATLCLLFHCPYTSMSETPQPERQQELLFFSPEP